MLQRAGKKIDSKEAVLKIKDASYPAPFASELEYNSPVHGNWNIVHSGMQVPESIQIYVCADNCMRGVVLTAAEMNAADRFSFVILEEQDLLNSNLEDITVEGVTDVLNKRGDHPKAVLLFTVCLHHFVGSNLDYIYSELEHRFPDICFIRCYMDPIMQKHGLTPDQKLRKAMYDPLPEGEPDERAVSVLGSDFALNESSDIKRLLKRYGYKIAILSGGFTYFGNYLKQKYGIDYVYANELEIVDGKLTGRYLGDVVDGKRKAELLKLIAQVEKVDIAQTIAVGDGANDLPMLSTAGLGIAFHAKPKVVANAKQSINTIGLDGVLYFLGFKDSYLEERGKL